MLAKVGGGVQRKDSCAGYPLFKYNRYELVLLLMVDRKAFSSRIVADKSVRSPVGDAVFAES